MSELLLPALDGSNPLGFLAALGALDAVTREGHPVRLRWTEDLVPQAVLEGIGDTDDLLEALDRDRINWAKSLVLTFPANAPLPDAKPGRAELKEWFDFVFSTGRGVDAEMLPAIVAEGAYDRSGKAKPTHLHFTAGQQQFLEMVRTLAAKVTIEMLREATFGPWAYQSSLPSLSWDSRGERPYAIRATNPSGEKRRGVPGADWLAFRGLIFYPVSNVGGALLTTACDRDWKSSAFRWPLWSAPVNRDVVRSLVADRSLVSEFEQARKTGTQRQVLAARGITKVFQSPIRRTDQGGYGSFSGPETLASA